MKNIEDRRVFDTILSFARRARNVCGQSCTFPQTVQPSTTGPRRKAVRAVPGPMAT